MNWDINKDGKVDWRDFVAGVAQVAPTIATALGSPIAGTVISFLASACGFSNPDNKNDFAQQIVSNPENMDKLQELEDKHSDLINQLLKNKNASKVDLHLIVDYDKKED